MVALKLLNDMRIFRYCRLLFPASFKLAFIDSFHMLHLLPWLKTFNIVGCINERELNNWCGVSSICNSLHIELHLICSGVCCIFPCHTSFKPDMHHTWLCIMPCLWLCLPCCLLLSGLLPSLASVPFGVVRIRLSSSWTCSSSLRDLRQYDHPSKSLLSLLF